MKQRERIVASLAFALAFGTAVPLFAQPADPVNADNGAVAADNGSNAIGSGSLNGNDTDIHTDTDTRNTTLNTNLTANGNNTGEQVTDSGNGNNLSRNETETRTTTIDTKLEAEGNNTGTQVTDSGNGNNLSRNESETQTTTNSADNKGIVANDDSDVYSMNDSFNRKDVDVRKTEIEFNLSNTRAADGSAAATGGDASVANSNNTAITNTAGDNGIVASTGADVDADYNSNNRNEAEDGSVAVLGSGSATVDSSRHDSHDTTITIKDVTVEVASSDLDGTVSDNTMSFAKKAAGPKTGDTALNGHALSSASGIVVLSQNTGMTSLVQQSVNVQVNK